MREGASAVHKEEFHNPFGHALRIQRRFTRGPLGRLAERGTPLERRLDLVHGVGPHTCAKLERQGYTSLVELARHPRFGRSATRIWSALARRDARALLAAGARDVELLPLFQREEMVVVDIETAGLAQVMPVFLIGAAVAGRDSWEVRQYLARSFEEEAAVLHQVKEEIGGRSVCVSYNGKAFDEPFIRARFGLYGFAPLSFRLHVDLLHACRRKFGREFPNCKLTTMASGLLGLEREDDVSGAEVPDLYYRYVRDGDEEAIAPVIEHNAADLQALAWLLDAFIDSPSESGLLTAAGGDQGVS